MMHLKIFISVDLSRCLLIVVSALVSLVSYKFSLYPHCNFLHENRTLYPLLYWSKQLLSNRSCLGELRLRLERRFLVEKYRAESTAERSRA